ncbi:MAG TPA: type III pantothenate kinase [Chitinophagaceae bacterium]|nr:type III pantothenate kinase [Chitinophagaceae bacterium]
MTKTLCLDFGNTRLKAALFAGAQLQDVFVLVDDVLPQLERIVTEHQPAFSILSSVIDHDPAIETFLKAHTSYHKLTHHSRLPFTIPVAKPETVGTDRMAIAAAAVHLFPHQNTLAIATGSCITYNFINQQHQLIGGSISPGMQMRLRAMHEYTAKLPLVVPDWNVPLIGYDTATNMQSGVVLGIAKEIEGIIAAYESRFGNFNAVLTGGDIPFFEPHLKKGIFADFDLIFKGLYAISQFNQAS